MFGALLFDLDGTLIDSEPWHKLAEIEAFHSFGIDVTDEDLAPYMGATLFDLLSGIGARFGKCLNPENFLEIEMPILTELIETNVVMFDEVFVFLDRTRNRRRALVTSSMPWYVERVLNRFPLIADSMEFIVTGTDVVLGKPFPEGYMLAASKLGVSSSNCCVFEDSVNGCRAGKSAGSFVAAINRSDKSIEDANETWPWLDFDRLRKVESDRLQRL